MKLKWREKKFREEEQCAMSAVLFATSSPVCQFVLLFYIVSLGYAEG